MKKIKRYTVLFLAMLMAFTLTACGGKETGKEVSIDTAKLAEELLAAVTSDSLTKMSVDPSTVYLYDSADVTSAVAYTSSGATACEVAVIEAKDSASAETILTAFRSRVDSQSDLYASYNAGEVSKLDKAILKSAGKYAVLCVCDDTEKADQILKDSGF